MARIREHQAARCPVIQFRLCPESSTPRHLTFQRTLQTISRIFRSRKSQGISDHRPPEADGVGKFEKNRERGKDKRARNPVLILFRLWTYLSYLVACRNIRSTPITFISFVMYLVEFGSRHSTERTFLSQKPTNLDRFHVVYDTDGFDDEKHADRWPFHRLHLGDVVSVQGLQALFGSDQHRSCLTCGKHRRVSIESVRTVQARACRVNEQTLPTLCHRSVRCTRLRNTLLSILLLLLVHAHATVVEKVVKVFALSLFRESEPRA